MSVFFSYKNKRNFYLIGISLVSLELEAIAISPINGFLHFELMAEALGDRSDLAHLKQVAGNAPTPRIG